MTCKKCQKLRWVDVIEAKKPELMRPILLKLKLGTLILIKQGVYAGREFFLLEDSFQNSNAVTHWMEIPE